MSGRISAKWASTSRSSPKCVSPSTSRTPRSTTTCRCCSAPSATRHIEARSVLAWNRYGKSQVRLVKLRRGPASRRGWAPGGRRGRPREPHEIVDLTIDVQLEGAFDAVYVDGDNAA